IDHLYLHSFPTRRSSDLVLEIHCLFAVIHCSGYEIRRFWATFDKSPKNSLLDSLLPVNLPARTAGLHSSPKSPRPAGSPETISRSEEHTSELQSPYDLVC